MAKCMLLFLVWAVLLVSSCKKEEYGTITTQLEASGIGQKSGIYVKLYGVSALSWLIDSLYTDVDGVADFGKHPVGTYSILAIWEDTLPNGDINHYELDTSFTLSANQDLVLAALLPCTCCPTFGCVNGTLDKRNCWCACEVGYHGTVCDTLSRGPLLGSFLADDPCAANDYNVTISPGDHLGAIVISNLGNMQLGGQPLQIKANMQQGHVFNIPQQSFNSGNIIIMGSGTLDGTTLTVYTHWKKTVNNVAQNESCKITMELL